MLDWPAQRVEEMRPSDLRDRLKDHQKAIRMLVRWLRGAPNKLPADGPQISAEPLRWALTVALQRNPLGKARFPLVEDLLQCTTAPWEVNVQLEQPENVGEPAAYQLSNAVLGGSALLRECPELPMDLMMFQLGAIRSDNPNPLGFEVAVAVTDLRAIRLLPHLLQKRLRSSLHPKKEIHFTLDAPEIEAPLKAALRVASLTENELAAIADGSVSFNAAEMFSPENELLVYSYLWAAVQNRTNAMTTELHRSIFDYQREVHNSPAHHTFAHFLAEYQFQYLQLLDKLASFFTAQVTSLRSQHRISLGSSIMHLAEEEQPDTIL
ncbi:MAG: hypothetical protein Q8P67_09175 [archaeon]|nr:hypothetical protein [archaeon]